MIKLKRHSRILIASLAIGLSALACNLPDTDTPSVDQGDTRLPTTVPEVTEVDDSSQSLPTAVPVDPVNRPTELSPELIDRIMRASVQIIAAQERGSRLESLWTGSGTLISPKGEILTNCHVACGAPYLIIALTTNPDQPAAESYFAEITHFDEDLDLALLQITHDIDGNEVRPTDLPHISIGDSNTLGLGDPIRIFGYPGVGGSTITFTSGSVSGFESVGNERVIIKTDADIAGGNSGGTAVDLYGNLIGVPTWVNPDVRDGVTIGGIGVLRPVNLIEHVRSQSGAPPPLESADLPPSDEPDGFEPNDGLSTATGPLDSGETVKGYMSWQDDIDVFYFNTRTTQNITVALENIPGGTDYDLYLLDSNGDIIDRSENESGDEQIQYAPSTTGMYYVVVVSYSGSSTTAPYTLSATYDGGGSSSGDGTAFATVIQVTGRVVDGNTGRAIAGGVMGILNDGVSCNQFFNSRELDMSLVASLVETDDNGFFILENVPVGAQYATFFLLGSEHVCEDRWLDVPSDAIDSDIGTIDISF